MSNVVRLFLSTGIIFLADTAAGTIPFSNGTVTLQLLLLIKTSAHSHAILGNN